MFTPKSNDLHIRSSPMTPECWAVGGEKKTRSHWAGCLWERGERSVLASATADLGRGDMPVSAGEDHN